MSYTTATPKRREVNADGRVYVFVEFAGDAGEPVIEESVFIDWSRPSPLFDLRRWAIGRITTLNGNKTFYGQVAPFIDIPLDLAQPPPDAVTPSTFGSFMAASAPFTPGATPQDVFTITGSATKVVRVTRLTISTVQTTAGMNAWLLVKRSTANTGGTSVAETAIPIDDSYPAATAVVRRYTANPTAGTLIGSLWSGRIPSPAPATALAMTEKCLFDGREAVILTGTTDVLAWNFNGAALPAGLSVQASVWWTES